MTYEEFFRERQNAHYAEGNGVFEDAADRGGQTAAIRIRANGAARLETNATNQALSRCVKAWPIRNLTLGSFLSGRKLMGRCHPVVIRAAIGATLVVCPPALRAQTAAPLNPSIMPRLGTVDERFQSYNVEMVEVTGGRFWKPYGTGVTTRSNHAGGSPDKSDVPAGMDPDLYEYRPPIDLANPKLRRLAAALGPAYLRVSGTWANTTYLAETDEAPSSPPPGFGGALSRQQWRGAVEFAGAVNAKIVTSMAISPGVRDASGQWTPKQARRFIEFTRSAGGEIAAAEFMNEPTMAAMGGAPKEYDAAAYGRDFKVFEPFIRQTAPGMIILGPGSVGETTSSDSAIHDESDGMIATRDLLRQSGKGIDAFSYHYYGAASLRCAGTPGMPQTTAEAALSEEWLARTDQTLAFYRKLRDEFAPGKPMWVTETADAACGGNPWGSTFLDTFRYLDQLGRLAKAGVQVVMHNTLAASDYGLLDGKTLSPRPNYWAALLWRKLMGTTVLDTGVPIALGQHVYAHCQRGMLGGVTLLAINNDKESHVLETTVETTRYTLAAEPLESHDVKLNGAELKLGENDSLPPLEGAATAAGPITLAPATITFLTVENSGNAVCRQ
jgi:Glycosyl hydrolase family 79, N-terminal domain